MIYAYWIGSGLATVHKMDVSGNDDAGKLKRLGRFENDAAAKKACIEHHKKACSMAKAAGRDEPEIRFI